MLANLLDDVMPRLAARRPIFHSEADFQLALAWEVQLSLPKAQIRLEKRVANKPRIELDVLILAEGRRMALELKYPKHKIEVEVSGELFALPTGASDVERYDVWRDVVRLERLCAEGTVDEGCALVLTNSPAFWSPPPRSVRTGYDAFRVHSGREASGTLDWGPTAGPGTRAGRTQPLTLADAYIMRWRSFSEVGTPGVELRYLPIMVRPARARI